jgi:hypothetical protein
MFVVWRMDPETADALADLIDSLPPDDLAHADAFQLRLAADRANPFAGAHR